MKTASLLTLVLAASCHAQQVKMPGYGLYDYSLMAGTAVSRAMDYTSTHECLQRSWCREQILPEFVVNHKATFIGFEAGSTAVSLWAQNYGVRHGHRTLSRIIGTANVSLAFEVDAHNYAIAKRRP